MTRAWRSAVVLASDLNADPAEISRLLIGLGLARPTDARQVGSVLVYSPDVCDVVHGVFRSAGSQTPSA